MQKIVVLIIAATLCQAACNQVPRVDSQPDKLVLRFEIDSNGNILNEEVKARVIALGKELQRTADKMVLSSYTEQSGSSEQNAKTAMAMARAVRELLKKQGERNATNVAIEIKGYQNPVDSVNPENIVNRRIEIAPK